MNLGVLLGLNKRILQISVWILPKTHGYISPFCYFMWAIFLGFSLAEAGNFEAFVSCIQHLAVRLSFEVRLGGYCCFKMVTSLNHLPLPCPLLALQGGDIKDWHSWILSTKWQLFLYGRQEILNFNKSGFKIIVITHLMAQTTYNCCITNMTIIYSTR